MARAPPLFLLLVSSAASLSAQCSTSAMHAILHTGARMPLLGLGTWKAPSGVTERTVYEAIRVGYRHLDCACDYGNEHEVGAGIQAAIRDGLVTREDLWITSKLWNTYHAPEHVELAARKSLQDLQIDYFDLYLIHFPISLKFVSIEERYPPEWIFDPSAASPRMEFADVPYAETWRAMEALVPMGVAMHIGVSNLNAQMTMDLLKSARIKPAVNQIELHPYLQQTPLIDWLRTQDIHVTGFSPLGSSSYITLRMDKSLGMGALDEDVIARIAEAHGKTPAQVVLRWGIQRGTSIVPKSVSPARLVENSQVFDFELTPAEMGAIAGLNRNLRFNDPGEFCKGMGGAYPIYA